METQTINTGESFEISLEGKGTAGYEWQYKTNWEDIIEVEQKKQPVKRSRSILPGSSTDEVFTVTGLKAGNVTLHFYLVRTWEDDAVEPKDEKKIKIQVE